MDETVFATLRPVKVRYNENLTVLGFEMSNGSYAQGLDDQDEENAPEVLELPSDIVKVDFIFRKNQKLLHSIIFYRKDGTPLHIGITDEMDE